jgi:hypothetical protein
LTRILLVALLLPGCVALKPGAMKLKQPKPVVAPRFVECMGGPIPWATWDDPYGRWRRWEGRDEAWRPFNVDRDGDVDLRDWSLATR